MKLWLLSRDFEVAHWKVRLDSKLTLLILVHIRLLVSFLSMLYPRTGLPPSLSTGSQVNIAESFPIFISFRSIGTLGVPTTANVRVLGTWINSYTNVDLLNGWVARTGEEVRYSLEPNLFSARTLKIYSPFLVRSVTLNLVLDTLSLTIFVKIKYKNMDTILPNQTEIYFKSKMIGFCKFHHISWYWHSTIIFWYIPCQSYCIYIDIFEDNRPNRRRWSTCRLYLALIKLKIL